MIYRTSQTAAESDTLQAMRETATFLKTFLRHPTQVGAIAPSGPGLVRAMVEWFDWGTCPGDCRIRTGHRSVHRGDRGEASSGFDLFRNRAIAEMAAVARQRCPNTTIYEDSVTNVADLCRQRVDRTSRRNYLRTALGIVLQFTAKRNHGRDIRRATTRWTICNVSPIGKE